MRPPVEIVREALEHVRYDEHDGYTPRLVQESFASLVEQLEAARTHRIYKRMVEMEEQLVAARHERSVACDWAAELAGEKRALQASVEIIQQERDALLASVRDHCSRPPGVCYPASAPDVDGLPCKGTGAEYLVEQDNSNPASVGSSDEAGGAPTSPATYPATKASEGGSAAASDGSEPETSGHGSAERLSRPAVPSSEASDPAKRPT